MSISRQHVTIQSQDFQLSAFVHRPVDRSQACPAVIMFHGLMGSANQPHRIFVDLADKLAQAGIISLRLDFRGRGDSEGNSIDVTPTSDVHDARCALDYLLSLPEVDKKHIALVGISWGGDIAAYLAQFYPDTAAIVCWSSLPSVTHSWKPRLQEFNGRQAAENWAYLVSKEFYEEVNQFDCLSPLKQTGAKVLIVYGSGDESIPARAIQSLQTELEQAGIELDVISIADADHIFMNIRHRQTVLEKLGTWLVDTLSF